MGRFTSLVNTPEGIESFKARYRIHTGVSIRYCHQEEWHTTKQEGEVVIPMIAFIEGGMRIPNVLKCILVIRLCGRYLLITMLNLYN